ncbi:MAG: beta-lactamase family protein [Flavipsychrobacter sp.]|nr:beta-lactamase family protein [Flavipsychrobacter sp.]
MYKLIIRSLLLLLLPAIAGAQVERAEETIQHLIDSGKAVGIAVAVVKDNKLVYSQNFGYKELESKTQLSNTDIFRIASISKSFSATAILQLVKARKLKLSDDVSELIGFNVRNPRYPDKVITLEHLLSHRSSINDRQGYFTLDAINPAKNPNADSCYNAYAPGEGYQYCNLNFNMIGTIIEKYSGERFDQYIKKHILDPLGLYGGYCIDSLDASRFATIYEYVNDTIGFRASPGAYAPRSEEIRNYTMGYSTPIFSPTGGMKISAIDLARYMMMHMNYGKSNGKRIIPRKLSQQMQTPLSSKENYGLALHKTTRLIADKELVGHTGSAYGLYSAMFFDPAEKWGIVVISNGCHPSYVNGYNGVIRTVFESIYGAYIKK